MRYEKPVILTETSAAQTIQQTGLGNKAHMIVLDNVGPNSRSTTGAFPGDE